MLRSANELKGYSVETVDNEKFKVDDFYFDDQVWTVRYFVINTGKWLPGRLVLISPVSIEQPDWALKKFPVNLTNEMIENSPDINADKPVSRQMEIELAKYYSWPSYWAGMAARVPGMFDLPPEGMTDPDKYVPEEERQKGDPHLRSIAKVSGYHIQAVDGEIGHVEDFILDDDVWIVRYLVIDTKNWLPGRKVLITPDWTERVDWEESKVHVELTRESIKNSPEYDPSQPVNREYEEKLYDYYGRPKYWQ